MAFKQKQKEDQKALEALKTKAAGKGPLSKNVFVDNKNLIRVPSSFIRKRTIPKIN